MPGWVQYRWSGWYAETVVGAGCTHAVAQWATPARLDMDIESRRTRQVKYWELQVQRLSEAAPCTHYMAPRGRLSTGHCLLPKFRPQSIH
jgi:hypothetical protein